MTRRQAVATATTRLEAAGVQAADQDARILLAHCLNLQVAEMLFEWDKALSEEENSAFEALVSLRERRKPVSQILGRRAFWTHEFKVTSDVLDPRPETEQIIETALSLGPFSRILDLGTGSGCILISLLAERPSVVGIGTDISDAALKVAQENAETIGVSSRAQFLRSDWFETVTGQFDLIVSNPPYIASSEMPNLASEVHDWEPHLALSPGGDGLGAYRQIAKKLGSFLSPGGHAILETGVLQVDAVTQIFAKSGFESISAYSDLTGRPRGICIQT